MSRRKALDDQLRALCENVYYQPPASIKMKYPCFRYNLANIFAKEADNMGYIVLDRYTVIYITKDPDDEVPHRLLETIQKANYDRNYCLDGLYHHVFSIYK